MKTVEIYTIYYGKMHFTRTFLDLVAKQKSDMRELEKLYASTNLKIPRGNVKNFYRLLLNVEYEKRKYLKTLIKKYNRLMNKYTSKSSDKFKIILEATANSLEHLFNKEYPLIKLKVSTRNLKVTSIANR